MMRLDTGSFVCSSDVFVPCTTDDDLDLPSEAVQEEAFTLGRTHPWRDTQAQGHETNGVRLGNPTESASTWLLH